MVQPRIRLGSLWRDGEFAPKRINILLLVVLHKNSQYMLALLYSDRYSSTMPLKNYKGGITHHSHIFH